MSGNESNPDPRPEPEPTPARGKSKIPSGGWKIRFDAPPQPGASSRAATGDVLALFRAWEGASRRRVERRRSPRYTPAETRTWVGWWRHGHFLVSSAELVNLSEGGALLRLSKRPPTSQPVWICLGTPNPVDYVQARVLDVNTVPDPARPQNEPHDPFLDACDPARFDTCETLFQTRLKFHEPCPTTFFETVGRAADAPADR